MTKRLSFAYSAVALLSLAGCSQPSASGSNAGPAPDGYEDFLVQLAEVYKAKPKEYSRAYALTKNGIAGRDWLATFHGLPDNRAACEETIAPYVDDPSLSQIPSEYFCEEIDADYSVADENEP